MCTCWMWTARPPAVFRRRGHMLHLKCFAFWCCMRTGGRGISIPRMHNTLTRTLFILKFALTVPAPWPDNLLLLSFYACWSLRGPTCLFFFLAIVLRATSFGGKGKPENGNSGRSVTNVTRASHIEPTQAYLFLRPINRPFGYKYGLNRFH